MGRYLLAALLGAALLLLATAAGPAGAATPGKTLDPETRFFAPPPQPSALRHSADLLRQRRPDEAGLIGLLAAQPRAVWFTEGSPAAVRAGVQGTVAMARARDSLPVLVAYNIPGRDCASLSAGGAATTAEYKAWIDGFAAGIGDQKALVVVEPDALGLLPSTCPPMASYPFTDAQRYEELNYAVDRLGALPRTLVYLDGTNSHWLSVGESSVRLLRAGVERTQGFFLNVSNFRRTEELNRYGTWISKCFAFASNPDEGGWRLGHHDWCASQYYSPNGPVNPEDPSTWHHADAWYDANLGNARPSVRFVVDTSRNGQGAWAPPNPPYPDAGAAQDWCNPPGRGLGQPSTARTGVPLVDAYLWIKVPGESDGRCARGLGPPGTTVDPEWGVVDPAAGAWFRPQALELARLANPPLRR
jgi:endoglucanase